MSIYARPSYMPKYWPLPSSCVLYLEGQQDPQSATIKDLSGNANHGTITGATWVRLPSGLWCLSFDGDDYVTVANESNFDNVLSGKNYPFTALFWLYGTTDLSASNGGIWAKGDTTVFPYDNFIACEMRNNSLYLWMQNDPSAKLRVHSAATHVTNTPELWSVDIDGSRVAANTHIHRNGVLQDLTTDNDTFNVGGTLVNNDIALILAKESYRTDSGYLRWVGRIPLFRIFNAVLSTAQNLNYYQQERHLSGA